MPVHWLWRTVACVFFQNVPPAFNVPAKLQPWGELADENKILRGVAADFDRAKKALGKDKVEAAVESVKQEEARVQAEKHRKRQYSR